ncbi:MAG: outer membrane protein [Desulfovibrionales bacterium]|jgi:outer membrane protein|nr:outer membrane protein [Desulfovibrionales bacterium]
MRNLLLLAMILFLAAPQAAFAQDVKIGVLSMQEVFRKSEAGVAAMDQLKGKFEDMKSDLEKRQQELQKMREDLQKQALVLSLEAKQDKELEFKRKVRYYQDLEKTYKTKMDGEQDRLSKPIFDALLDIIEDYGKKNNYTVILDKNSQFSGLIYIDNSIDITNQIIVELNRVWRAKAKK